MVSLFSFVYFSYQVIDSSRDHSGTATLVHCDHRGLFLTNHQLSITCRINLTKLQDTSFSDQVIRRVLWFLHWYIR